MDVKELKALINLLDDPDENIFKVIQDKILSIGIDAIEEMEKAWEGSLNELLQRRIENLIHKIHLQEVQNDLSVWVNSEADNLLKGAFIVAKYQYPDLKIETINEKIEKISKDVWLELHDNLTDLEKVKILNHIIFDIHKFSSNSTNFYSPKNSYISDLLDTKKGNPISLSILYIIVAQGQDLPIYGVNLPKNFVLAYKDEIAALEAFSDENEEVLFYINPFNKGAVFGRREIDFFIKQQKLEPIKSYYMPCNNIEIIKRLLSNLVFSYEKLGYTDKIEELNQLLKIVEII